MNLNYKILGEGEPLIIFHGLYGSLDNWIGIARELKTDFKVILVDLRNHGKSPHSNEHNYNVMADDLLELMNSLGIYSANLLGHSMGGKVVLSFALINPERVKRLIVVDIAPRTYKLELGDKQISEHSYILSALKSLNIDELTSRDQANEQLSKEIPNERIRAFLLKNLYRDSEKHFKWRLNIEILRKSLDEILEGFEDSFSEFKHLKSPVLFIKGGVSEYISNQDTEQIKNLFSNCTIEIIDQASHWVHAEKPAEFIQIVRKFCL